ncbi:hypothetical protein IFM89_007651 [Coptis chinensis]|uniref:Uncharacterized protein n=1 Tax=Coptis chinensis TaxID=261450 RepID=A0A835HRJ8_9MAGN|nr:hypothetical protein IFM89_007651 [Coptis chinensis]
MVMYDGSGGGGNDGGGGGGDGGGSGGGDGGGGSGGSGDGSRWWLGVTRAHVASLVDKIKGRITSWRWTIGSPTETKKTTMTCDKVCKPYEEGGLCIRRLRELNLTFLMKLGWHVLNKNDDFANFMRSKYFTIDNKVIKCNVPTSIWPGIKWDIEELDLGLKWVLCNGSKVYLWKDAWLGPMSINQALNRKDREHKGLLSQGS